MVEEEEEGEAAEDWRYLLRGADAGACCGVVCAEAVFIEWRQQCSAEYSYR